MTATTATTRSRPRRSTPDLSYLLSRGYKENPDFLLSAVDLGGFISCSVCHRVVGVGANEEMAIDTGLREGTAARAGNAYVCSEHAGE